MTIIQKNVAINDINVGNNLPFALIAGPCQIESRDMALYTAEFLTNLTTRLNIPFIYKSSFDKANRTSLHGARGIGLDEALDIFAELKAKIGCNILTDVHKEEQCEVVASVVDVLQIPALLCRQTDLLVAAARTGKVVNIKKGQFLAPWDMKNAVEKVVKSGNPNVLITERGSIFGYNRLVNDMKSIVIMAEENGLPIVFDATHSVQEPSAQGSSSGGQRQYVAPLARAAVAVGVACIFLETHPDPDNAHSDGPCMVPLNELEALLIKLKKMDEICKALAV